MRADVLRLADMLESIENIRGFISGGRATFFTDEKTHEAVAYEVLKLGEAANRISPSFRRNHSAVPWKRIVALRNAVVHEYFRVDLDALWEFASKELDALERDLRRLQR